MPLGPAYMIDGSPVVAPASERWKTALIGTAIDGTQRRSPYWILEWSRSPTEQCDLEWFVYDNTTLTELVTRAPGVLGEWTAYTDVRCQSVQMRQAMGVGLEMVATFLVNVG